MRSPRPWTPDVDLPGGGKRITVKRACNGCRSLIGDVTEREIERAIAGLPIEDVRGECERCTPIDWNGMRKCPVCHAAIGEACRSLSGTVTGGRPDGVGTVLAVPHNARKPRSGAVAS